MRRAPTMKLRVALASALRRAADRLDPLHIYRYAFKTSADLRDSDA